MRLFLSSLALALSIALLGTTDAVAQVGGVSGTIKDSSGAVLPGAQIELQNGPSAVSDGQGQFLITNVAPGTYTATVNYVGFAPSTTSVTVTASQTARLNVVLDVASKNDVVIDRRTRAWRSRSHQ
jgi:Carboxypeptidase regulatory-like domain